MRLLLSKPSHGRKGRYEACRRECDAVAQIGVQATLTLTSTKAEAMSASGKASNEQASLWEPLRIRRERHPPEERLRWCDERRDAITHPNHGVGGDQAEWIH